MSRRAGVIPDRYYTEAHQDRDWMVLAACRGQDPELWFPARHHDRPARTLTAQRTRHALETCVSCPVMTACLHHALVTDTRYGIWGGATEADRARLTGRRVFG